MTRNKANPTLLGAFVVGGVLLLVAGLIAAAGGSLFSRRDRVVMLFDGSTYGLQVGAPVVFRGVRLGSVATIGLLYDPASDTFRVPVVAELERNMIKTLQDQGSNSKQTLGLPALVAKGLSAQLSMQSLLTGQLYVDLDLRPAKPQQPAPTAHRHLAQDALEIPTTTTALQNIKNQLDTVDFRRLLDDVGAIATSARTLVAGPQLKQALDDLAQITGNVKPLTARLDQRVDPLAQAAQGAMGAAQSAMGAAQRALGRLGAAADRTGAAASQVGSAADRVGELANPASPLLLRVQQTADELARTASALRSQTADDAPAVQQLSRALQDVSQAARAVRELAELLDRQPDALLRGRGAQDTAR